MTIGSPPTVSMIGFCCCTSAIRYALARPFTATPTTSSRRSRRLSLIARRHRQLGDARFPIRTRVAFGQARIGTQHAAPRLLALPERERNLVHRHARQPAPFQRAEDRFAGDLLPPGAGLLIAHDEVLVVDPRQVEVQRPSVDRRLPHQTGVTERSISGDDRHRRRPCPARVVIGHLPDRIGRRLAVALDRHHHFGVGRERRRVAVDVARVRAAD